MANYIPVGHAPVWGQNDLFTPKKLWLRDERRFLTFREILGGDLGTAIRGQQYDQIGIEPMESTPEEITALAVEMDERLKGTWTTEQEDEELQQRFWTLFKQREPDAVCLSRIGAEFLRQNRELLE